MAHLDLVNDDRPHQRPPPDEEQDHEHLRHRTHHPGRGQQDRRRPWHAIAAASNATIADVGPGVSWRRSYVTGYKLYCVYDSDDPALIRRHGEQGGFPVDVVNEVARVIEPATGGADTGSGAVHRRMFAAIEAHDTDALAGRYHPTTPAPRPTARR